MKKYHVALSFAGEDREYVEKVAASLKVAGVKVFFADYEQAKMWGKNLYTYLIDVYKDQAYFSVIFISDAYKKKLWTSHEWKAAQARAFTENSEYILPAFFDPSIKLPGLLDTVHHIDLTKVKPKKLAEIIVEKLKDSNVLFAAELHFGYADEALADIDFPMNTDDEISGMIKAFRSHTFHTQSPAITKVKRVDWATRSGDEAFVIGRNIYQAACGNEWKACEFLGDLRRELASLPTETAEHMLNGMFYEVYFDHTGKFRGKKLKGTHMSSLFALQTVPRYAKCVLFMQNALEPYRDGLAVIPNSIPDIVKVMIRVSLEDKPVVIRVIANGREQVEKDVTDKPLEAWKISRGFTRKEIEPVLHDMWHIPKDQLELTFKPDVYEGTEIVFDEGESLGYWHGL